MISNTLEKLIASGLIDPQTDLRENEELRKINIQKVDQMNPKLRFIGDFPHVRKSGWSERLQGVTHDDDHWYFSQTNYIWKIPVTKSLELFIEQ